VCGAAVALTTRTVAICENELSTALLLTRSRMESGVHVANSVLPSSPVLHTIPERSQVLSPTRLAKLPPIAASTDEHPSASYLQVANTELKESMRNLHVEVTQVANLHLPLVPRPPPTAFLACITKLWGKLQAAKAKGELSAASTCMHISYTMSIVLRLLLHM